MVKVYTISKVFTIFALSFKINAMNYKITTNKRKKTYTIRVYNRNKLFAKYRTAPQGSTFTTEWTEDDIKHYLGSNHDYTIII